MSLISRTSQYALRAMALLAVQQERLTVKELADSVGAPQPYLARIIMVLASGGYVDARRGPRGGLKLGKKAEDITLMNIIGCFDGQSIFDDCFLGLDKCSKEVTECSLHTKWDEIREDIKKWWEETSLAQFSGEEIGNVIRTRSESINQRRSEVGPSRGRWS